MVRLTLALLALAILCACDDGPPPDMTDPGQLLFMGYVKKDVNCSRCHGVDGKGGEKAPSLDGVFAKLGEDGVLDIIEEGKKGKEDDMPPFEGMITDDELTNLLAFLKTLQSQPAPGN